MNIITDRQIESLNISPLTCIEWVKEAFLIKDKCELPPKTSLHPQGSDFINTMPCLLPADYATYSCKIVSRVQGQTPTLNSKVVLYNTLTGKMTGLLDGNWITKMRTGAVAALAINTLRKSDAQIYSFVGLGEMGYASLECFLASNQDRELTVRLKRYKNHAEKAISHFSKYGNVHFEIAETMDELVKDADVVVSCITSADELLVPDVTLFKPGVLVVPVHTRGFQNCDTTFDKVFADDEGHVSGFRYFNEFRKFDEIGNVLAGRAAGRETDDERILSYNIGIGIHDALFAYKLSQLIND